MNKKLQSVCLSLIIIIMIQSCAYTPAIKGTDGQELPGSVASLESIEINGVEQWILIRGEDVSRPILLFLHGGPGDAGLPLLRHFNSGLEEYFTVVTWDQRGAGKSYSRKISPQKMTLDQFIEDAHELTQILKNRFSQDKIYIVGHSWGAHLGLLLAQKYPEDYYAYVAVSQLVSTEINERLSYQFVCEAASEKNNKKALRQLEKIGEPESGNYRDGVKSIMIERKWVIKFGGWWYNRNNVNSLVKVLLVAKEYSAFDLVKWVRGSKFSGKTILPQIMGNVDMIKQVPKLNLPVYFCAGRHDYIVPSAQLTPYVDILIAPRKEIIWFENSAHLPCFEEPEKFNQVMMRVVEETYR